VAKQGRRIKTACLRARKQVIGIESAGQAGLFLQTAFVGLVLVGGSRPDAAPPPVRWPVAILLTPHVLPERDVQTQCCVSRCPNADGSQLPTFSPAAMAAIYNRVSTFHTRPGTMIRQLSRPPAFATPAQSMRCGCVTGSGSPGRCAARHDRDPSRCFMNLRRRHGGLGLQLLLQQPTHVAFQTRLFPSKPSTYSPFCSITCAAISF